MAKKLVWKNLVGQERAKETLAKAFENGSLGHAYLFCGDAGVGKFQAALELSLALLCKSRGNVPCYTCESCRQVLNHTHPDFRMVLPICLEKEDKGSGGDLSEEGWAHLDKECKALINDPYALSEPVGIPAMPVEWIRETNHALMRGSVKGGMNVAILCGVDLMNKESANAMLKTLEEPPRNTLIILTTDRPHALLPTIVSRCQLMRFGALPVATLAGALSRMLSRPACDEALVRAAACAEGSLGRARQMASEPLDEYTQAALSLLDVCGRSDLLEAAQGLDGILAQNVSGGKDYGNAERILLSVIYVVRERFLRGLGSTENYFNTETHAASCALLTGSMGPGIAQRLLDECQKAIGGVRARGNIPLVFATFLLETMEIVNGKEQPAG